MNIQMVKIKGEDFMFLPLKDLNKLIKSAPKEKEWYSLDEICKEFGVNDMEVEFTVSQVADIIGKKSIEVHRLIKTKILSAQKVGGRYMIKKAELAKYRNRGN